MLQMHVAKEGHKTDEEKTLSSNSRITSDSVKAIAPNGHLH